MKDIGQKLKEARENMQLDISEVAEDLKLRPSQIKNIEEGNLDSFSDVLSLKNFIKEYSKYLGLNYEDMVDEFNEYLFDYTSKISSKDIKKARQELNKKRKTKDDKISSPYTIIHDENKRIIPIIIIAALIVIVVVAIVLIVNSSESEEDQVITYNIRLEGEKI